ncbi:linear amide C-N hydrolase [Lampropedia aestuarii]|uniref:linear amide C-N hydrolase n=1 Tax=Lampropedia aestuarii TaxID=2562762 RepID=UPI002468953E|nr:linear amide C-N hydrolase [Lampropedia aestuarii]MDH5856757.1 linear amide C-N hydrolase [Lampropedia aestuarii]
MAPKQNMLTRSIVASLASLALIAPVVSQACTSMLYTDAHGAPYAGRTMELPMSLPYKIAYFPAGTKFGSKADNHHVLDFDTKHAFISVAVPDPVNGELKVSEGLNDKGLSFSLLAFASTDGPADMVSKTQAVLSAIDLGSWTLSQFGTVQEVKEALEKQPVLVTALLPLGLLKTPFHYSLHDATGKSIVIEFANGKQNVIDNPIGVMTNGPEFSWHMTNLNNYTFLSNIDHSTLEINGVKLSQPDSGIATVALPASNTSVGRFVRAVYYSQFAEKGDTPAKAMLTLANVMNNFDRPRGISADNRFTAGAINATAPGLTEHEMYVSEYTNWTSLMDLRNLQFNIRSYDSLNYVHFDLNELKKTTEKKVLALSDIATNSINGTQLLQAASK